VSYDTLNQVVLILLWILACILVYYPLIGIILCVLCGSFIFGSTLGTSFLIGVFSGALANYLFTFFADVILDVTTAMFTIVRIDYLNGVKIQGDLSAGSPSSVGTYYFKLSGDDTGTEMASTTVVVAAPQQQVTQVQVVYIQPVMMAQPYGAPMAQQAPAYDQTTMTQYGYQAPPGYAAPAPASDPYDASKPHQNTAC